ncbi:MAG TPA: transporter substrate-binding domain-containing protein, partial [Phormidium sp.]
MPKRKWLFAILFSIALSISLLFGGWRSDRVFAQSPQYQGKKFVMVTSADYPPYEFRDTASGSADIVGFDVDIANYIAKELGFQLEIKDTDFSGIIPAVQSGRADFAMAGMTPTAERKKNVDFSDIYYEAKNSIVARKGSNLTTPKSLAGKKVGVQL